MLRMADQPNIVLFLTDQLRADALGCYGNTICPTPNLDRFAANGMLFDNAFTTSPACSPSRASLMTGNYSHNHGVLLNTHIDPAFSRGLDPQTETFADVLKGAGYRTDYIGKWHVHETLPPTEYGFDRYEDRWGSRGDRVPGSEIAIDFPGGSVPVAATATTDAQKLFPAEAVTRGLEMINDRAVEANPFFLRIDVVEPHFECTPPEPFASLVDPKSIPPWPNFEETFEGKPMSHLRKHQEWHLEEYDWEWWSKVVAKYYGVISYVDACFGKLMEGLEESGLSNNTIVVFSTDHGDAMGSHKHFEKAGTLYDEVYRVPLIMGGPKRWVQPGKRKEFVRLLDLAPTFAEWAETEFSSPIDGLSAAPLAAGKTPEAWPDSVYAEYHGEVWGYNSQRMVRTENWKYGFEPNGLDELYDLKNDPHEMINLIDEAEHSGTVTEMRGRLHGWIDATADHFTWPWVKMNLPDPIMPKGITTPRKQGKQSESQRNYANSIRQNKD